MKQRKGILLVFVGILVISALSTSTFNNRTKSVEPYFTLVAKTNDGIRAEYLYFLQQHLSQIGIHLDVIIQDWPTFVGELIAFRDFDICYVALTGGSADPDMTGIYNENGSLNLFGYDTSMDYNETLGTGLNEWYLSRGRQIMPPDSQERLEHYWAWEEYLMDKICPLLPTFTPIQKKAYWENLEGYNISKGILQSWGNLKWNGSHFGQRSENELVISDYYWSDLNPLFQDDSSSKFISSSILDPLIWYDDNVKPWPHLAKNWTHFSDTHVRLTLREGIKWQMDPEGLFADEYFDARDVYFTIYCWTHISGDIQFFNWLDDMVIIDEYTIDFYIDGDPNTPEKEPEATYLPELSLLILPEHYLNQSQLPDNVSPDITHSSWNTFATNCFGTGLFSFDNFTEGFETVLHTNENSWWLNSSLTDNPALNWEERFGDFQNCPEILRVKINDDYLQEIELFQLGLLDLVSLHSYYSNVEDLTNKEHVATQQEITFYFGFFGFNMREERAIIGNREPCSSNPSITKGLAVRKAICYATDRNEMNNVIHSGQMVINDYPIYLKQGIWCNPDIIKYHHDIEKAREYMALAGYGTDNGVTQNNRVFSIPILLIIPIMILVRKKKNK